MMKKLKCESCGGDIELDENKEFATCPFCQTKYQLNETKKIYIKMDDDIKQAALNVFKRNEKFSKVFGFFFAIVFICVFSFIGYNIFKQVNGTDSFEVKRYNSKFEMRNGTQGKMALGSLLDDVVTNNKTNKHKITVVFDEIVTDNPSEIVSIKKSLKDDFSAQYEVGFDYDKKGLINKVTIEEDESSLIKDVMEKDKEYSDNNLE